MPQMSKKSGHSRRRRRLISAALGILLFLGLSSSNAAAPKKGGGRLITTSSADTTILYGPVRFTNSGSATVWHEYDVDLEVDSVLGKRFLIELTNGSSPITTFEALIDNQQWIGSGELGGADATLSRIVDITTTGTHLLAIRLKGVATRWVDVRVVRVNDPSFVVYPQTTYAGADTDSASFAKPNVGESVYTLRVINGAPIGSNRVTSGSLHLNQTSVIGSADLKTNIATVTRNISLISQNKLKVNIATANSQLRARVTADDATPPVITLTQPTGDTIYTAAAGVRFSGTSADETIALLNVNGRAPIVLDPLTDTFTDSIATTPDGKYPVTIQATNSAKLTTTLSRLVIRDTRNPTLTVSSTPAVTESLSIAVGGSWIDSTYTVVSVDGDVVGNAVSGSFGLAYPLDVGSNRILVRATDRLGHPTEVLRFVFRKIAGEAAAIDSNLTASSMDPTGIPSFYQGIRFLFTGSQPVQTGIDTTVLQPDHVAVLRGRVAARDFGPLPNVSVGVLGHPEYGQTTSRADGRFDMVVNGGAPLTLRFNKAGFLEAQRSVEPKWADFTIVDSLALIGKTARVSVIDTTVAVVAQARFASDANGDRRLKLFFDRGAMATVVTAGGAIDSFATYKVRATEYTVGGDGPEAMPATLPPSSAYTYCVELSADVADSIAQAGSPVTGTTFTKPVACYVRGFMPLPVGTRVPIGYYDKIRGRWVASTDGLVLRIKGLSGGQATVDVTGDDVADTTSVLDALGVDATERTQLASQFSIGDTVWRASVDHFSTWDFNLNLDRLASALSSAGGRAGQPLGIIPGGCTVRGSIIDCENRVLGERIEIVGTPYSLNYQSMRAPGDRALRTLRIPIGSDQIPAGVQKVFVIVDVAGQRLEQVVDHAPSLEDVVSVTWNGLDAYGRRVQGAVTANVQVGYQYNVSYAAGNGGSSLGNAAASRGSFGSAPGDRSVGRVSWIRQSVSVGAPSMESAGLGGWTISPHHFYDRTGTGTIYYGDGTFEQGRKDPLLWSIIVAGPGNRTAPRPTPYFTMLPRDIATGPDGSIYIADGMGSVNRVTSDFDSVYVVAGQTSPGDYQGDGPATATTLKQVTGLAFGPDGALYVVATGDDVAPNIRVMRVANDSIRTIAGTGAQAYPTVGLGGPATQAQLGGLNAIAVGPDGSVFISAGGQNNDTVIHRIGTNGIITQYAGGGTTVGTEDSALVIKISQISDMAIDGRGNLYIAEDAGGRIRKIAPDGWSTIIATDPISPPQGNWFPHCLSVAQDGSIWFTTVGGGREHVVRLDTDGTQSIIAGIGPRGGTNADGVPALAASLAGPAGVALGADGSIYMSEIAGSSGGSLRRIGPTLPTQVAGEIAVPSSDGSEIHYFNLLGRHLRTRDALTGAMRYSFTYDSGHRLHAIYHDGDSTVITRSGASPTAIIGPYGKTTSLGIQDGYLHTLTNPNSEIHTLSTDALGLLTAYEDPESHTYAFEYDEDGRLSRDDDPAGGSQQLSSPTYNTSGNSRVHLRTTGEDRKTQYTVTNRYDGTIQRSIELQGAISHLRTILSDSTDGRTYRMSATGLLKVDSLVGEPRFGMLAPVVASSRTRLPSGLTRVVERIRDYTASAFNPPQVDGVWVEEIRVNGGPPMRVEFDSATDTLKTYSPVGRVVSAALDTSGKLISIEVGGYSRKYLTRNSHGKLEELTQGSRTWTYDYNSNGNLESIADPIGRITAIEYDAAERETLRTLPDGSQVGYGYDHNGKLSTLRTPSGHIHEFAYDDVGTNTAYAPPVVPGVAAPASSFQFNLDRQLRRATQADGEVASFHYDEMGRLDSLTTSHGITQFAYDNTGRLETVAAPDTVTLTYSYDGAFVTSEEWSGQLPGGNALTISHSFGRGFLDSIQTVEGTSPVVFVHDHDGLLVGAGDLSIHRRFANGLVDSTQVGSIVSSLDYNQFGEMVNLRYSGPDSVFFQQSLSRDGLGRIAAISENAFGTYRSIGYRYDLSGRLYGVIENGDTTNTYRYDTNGNRELEVNFAGGVPSDSVLATYDDQDRLLTLGNVTFEYTAAGALRRKIAGSDTSVFEYDVLGNLVAAQTPSGEAVTYSCDGANRRVGRRVDGIWTGGWLYQDGLSIAADTDNAGNVLNRYVYGEDGSVPALVVRGDTTLRVISDYLGSIRGFVDVSSGIARDARIYDAWGNITDGVGNVSSLGYAAGIVDEDTGLSRFGGRDYDPVSGRWTCKDPFGVSASINTFAYVSNDPVNVTDPTGLIAYTCEQTQQFLQWASEDAQGFHGLTAAIHNHHVPGYLDFKTREPDATFIVDGRVMKADEFGNFIAGYAGYRFMGNTGYGLVRAAGVTHDIVGDSQEHVPLNFDKDSEPALRAGRAYAEKEAKVGRRGCGCPK